MAWDTHTSLQETHAFLHGWIADAYSHEQLDYAICLRGQPERVIGGIGALCRTDPSSYELGYILEREHWGRGLMREAAKLLLDQLFSKTRAVRVYAPILADNKQSRRFAEKLGLQLEGVLRSTRERYGQRKDEAIYALLRDEWPR